MSCIVGGPNVKSLAKSIQALARIGDDLYIESLPTGFVFRTVNSSRSAYVCMTFKSEFFVQYEDNSSSKCKVSLKSCVMAFRSLPTMEKMVEKCLVDTTSIDSTLLIQFSCKHDLTKVFHLPFIENEVVQTTFVKPSHQCVITAQTRLLHDGIQNFSSAVEEVTLMVSKEQVTLKNYVDEDVEQTKVVHTELTIEAEEFDQYEIEKDVDVTFSLKDFKALLSFAEGFNVPLTISCQCAGKPIVFTLDSVPGIESEFVLATLADQGIPSSSTPAQGSYVSGSQVEERTSTASTSRKNSKNSKAKNKTRGQQLGSVQVVTTSASEQQVVSQAEERSPVVENLNLNSSDHADLEPEVNANEVPMSNIPPSKKFRLEFLGLSSQSSDYTVLPEADEVLAEASDEDI